jgi:hypothetical protein
MAAREGNGEEHARRTGTPAIVGDGTKRVGTGAADLMVGVEEVNGVASLDGM